MILATLRTALRGAIYPFVTMFATVSIPYSFLQYSTTRSRMSGEKSESTSGMVTLSSFKKRSNSKSYCNGSIISVIPIKYATRLPAAEPLPAPTTKPEIF